MFSSHKDFKIAKLILRSGGEDSFCDFLKDEEENQDGGKHSGQLSLNKDFFAALAKSLTSLLQFKVSPAAYQRYSVRTSLIETLREWTRVSGRLSDLPIFTNSVKTTRYVGKIAKKFITDEIANDWSSIRDLVNLGQALLNLSLQNDFLIEQLETVVNKIADMSIENCRFTSEHEIVKNEIVEDPNSQDHRFANDPETVENKMVDSNSENNYHDDEPEIAADQIADSDLENSKDDMKIVAEELADLLLQVARKKDELSLSFGTMEKIYVSQRIKLIEEPLIGSFVMFSKNRRDELSACESTIMGANHSETMDELFDYISLSPAIFQISSSILKEILANFDSSKIAMSFVKFMLDKVQEYCGRRGKNILDLYPRNLQCCVMMLKIEPARHTQKSKDFTLKMLRDVYVENKDDLLILISHFPIWLEIFSSYFTENIAENVY